MQFTQPLQRYTQSRWTCVSTNIIFELFIKQSFFNAHKFI